MSDVYTISREYAEDDPKFMGDAMCVTLYRNGSVILSGDYYHDHIDDKISGYLQAIEEITGNAPKVLLERKTSEDY